MSGLFQVGNTYTVGQLADTLGKSPDTMRVYLRRRYSDKYPSMSWRMSAIVPDEIVAELLDKSGERKERKRTTDPDKMKPARAHTSEVLREFSELGKEKRAAFALPKFNAPGLSTFLVVGVYGHTVLVWYEIAAMFSMPGLLAGVVVFALKHAALTMCRLEKFSGLVDHALAVAFILDLLAWYVHGNIFMDNLPERLSEQMGYMGAMASAIVLGFVVAAGAFTMLLFIKHLTFNRKYSA